MRSLVYVSGPITQHPAGPFMSVRDGVAVGDALFDHGYAPIVPHLTVFWSEAQADNKNRDYEDWMALDLAIIEKCAAVYRIEGYSPGGDREIAFAQECGIPVFYDLDALYAAIPAQQGRYALQDARFTFACPDCQAAVIGSNAVDAGLALYEHGKLHKRLAEIVAESDAGIPGPIAAAIERVRATFRKKNADYAEEARSWDSNFRDVSDQMGWAGPGEACEALIAVKQARLRSMRSNGRLPQNESVEDTKLDRAVYSVIAMAIDLEAAGD